MDGIGYWNLDVGKESPGGIVLFCFRTATRLIVVNTVFSYDGMGFVDR